MYRIATPSVPKHSQVIYNLSQNRLFSVGGYAESTAAIGCSESKFILANDAKTALNAVLG
jgi:hypothetical protein